MSACYTLNQQILHFFDKTNKKSKIFVNNIMCYKFYTALYIQN